MDRKSSVIPYKKAYGFEKESPLVMFKKSNQKEIFRPQAWYV